MSDKIFAARDYNGEIYLYFCDSPPKLKENSYYEFEGDIKMVELDVGSLWDVQTGQCREIEITYKD